ncbi:peptide ABC transporter permease [Pseudomonas fluorescens]|jgi:peptide/nickel transport system permease protein|uniref:ABC transporter permease n=2 Tax=Pseudomonas TaxID=286 RepID=A0A5M8F307_PSEVE|nr:MULTISPECIES: ABC transporter permease [Pseudomonas]AHC35626.1 peptide ABC transporter permease [Pseudomonas sp. TKP]AOE67719.1 peptide ABC transporter permease [Pseudomonas fluorescens]AOE73533.1 peptide ABC transporter permease [Pseudomonas fluorescens]KAA6173041.1 ABC transporter permease [Pseudomonas veronii]KAA6178096.1 ABC transporter permease [Pseudomonas veronii]
MSRYLIGRIGQALLVLWGAYSITYFILYLLPGDTLSIMLSASGMEADALSVEDLAKARAYYGLDQGVFEQYFNLLLGALHGDFGQSLSLNRPVAELLAERLPQTLSLAGLAIVLSLLGGVGLAYLTAYLRWRPLKIALTRLPSLGFSVPVFWMGLLLIQVFAFGLGWFPATGSRGVESLVLPAITLAIPSAAVYAQVLQRSFQGVWQEPYIVTAYAKGLSRGQVQARHGFRNAALPILTLIGLQVGNTVSGAVLVETIFARSGIGRLAQEAVLRQDIPVVLAIVAVSAAAFVLVNLLVDLLYPWLDPRISHTPKVS